MKVPEEYIGKNTYKKLELMHYRCGKYWKNWKKKETCRMSIAEGTVERRLENSVLQVLYKFMKGKSGDRALGLYVLKGTRTDLRGKEGVITLLFPDSAGEGIG